MGSAAETRYTPEDLLRITDRPMPDLVGGRLEEREPMGQKADAVAGALIEMLRQYSRALLPGVVNGAHGSYQIFADDPEKVRIPDVSFTRKDRLPDGRPFDGHSLVVPDLVVEVVSPNDTATSLHRKIRDFLDAGVPLIWIIDPETTDVQVYRPDRSSHLLVIGDILDGGDILPGFSCPVAALFE